MKQKILITGVAGFLGSELARTLVQQGNHVVGVDDLSSSDDSRLNTIAKSHFKFVRADIRDSEKIRTALEGVGKVVHLAERNFGQGTTALTALEVNAEGTQSLLETVKDFDIHFILGSSYRVYGRCPDEIVTEDSPCVLGDSEDPSWTYAASKLMAEHFTYAFGDKYGFPVTILRYGPLFGPGHPKSESLIYQLLEQVLDGKVLSVPSLKNSVGNYTYITDAVSATIAALKTEKSHGEILNIASHESVNPEALAIRVWKAMGHLAKPFVKIAPKAHTFFDFISAGTLCTQKAEALLGFKAKTNLLEGLSATLQFSQADPSRPQNSTIRT